jgi:hypothetical protein
MMKNKAKLLGAGLLALLLALAGCSNPLNGKPEAPAPEAGSGGKIVISLGGLDARTLGPVAEDIATLQYRLIVEGDDEIIIEEDIADFSQPVERSIQSGYWTVGVWAYLEDGPETAWAEAEVTLKNGETKPVALILRPTKADVAGKFDYDIDFPKADDDFGYETTTLTLASTYPNAASTTPAIKINLRETGKDTAIQELPAGKYDLDIVLISTRQIQDTPLKVIVKETVYIYPGLTTKAHYTFTETAFGADVYLNGTAAVTNNTTRGEDDKPVHEYIPTEVQIQLYGYDPAKDEPVGTAPITPRSDGSYGWELAIGSEKLGGSGNVENVKLRFVATSKDDDTQKLISPWTTPQDLANIRGLTNIKLAASVYSIVQETGDNYFKGIQGVSGIAHDSDAIADNPVSLKIIPLDDYGVRGDTVYYSGGQLAPKPDGTFSFTMIASPVTVSAEFFHLKGTATIDADDTKDYELTTIEAYGEKWDDKEKKYVRDLIGVADIAAADGAWAIPIGGYVSGAPTADNTIQLKVTLKAAGLPDYSHEAEYPLSSLTGENTLEFTDILPFSLTGIRTVSTTDSITFHWETAKWATGYRIYRHDGADYKQITDLDLDAKAYSYTDSERTPGTRYEYRIVGVHGTPVVEGYEHNISVKATPLAPQNVTAALNETEDYPFQIHVSWDAVVGADYYGVYRSEFDGTGMVHDSIEIGTANTNSYDDIDTNKRFRSDYLYQIVAYTEEGLYSAKGDESGVQRFPGSGITVEEIKSWPIGKNISTEKEYDYFFYKPPSDDNYQFFLPLASSTIDVVVYIFVNGKQQDTLETKGDPLELPLKSTDVVYVVVRAFDFKSQGFYMIGAVIEE